MRAAFTPKFLASQPSETRITSAPVGVAPTSVRYDEQRYGSVEAFMLHADFAPFQQHYSRLIDDMIAFARDHANQLTPPITALRLQAIATDFATFKSHLFDAEQNFFSSHKSLVYGVGFDTVVQLSRLLHDTRIALQRRMDTVINVAPETTVCAGGCITGLQNALGVLNTSAHGITASAHRFKRQMLEYAALAHTRQHHRYYPGNEVHYANAYFNYGADALGVAPRPDPFTRYAESTITQELFNQFDKTVRQTLLPVTMTRAMADDYASRIKAVAETDDTGNIAADQIDATVQRITALQGTTLDAEFGPIPLNDFLMEIPADAGYRITKRPTLIAVRLMERLKKERLVAYEPVMLAKGVDGEADLLYLDGLLWINRKGQHEPLDKDLLCRTSPLTLFDTLSRDGAVDKERCLQIFCEIAEAVALLSSAARIVARHQLPPGWLKDFVAVLPHVSGSRKDDLNKQLLHMALRFDDGAAMHALLEIGVDKNGKTETGFSLASVAAALDFTSVLAVLLQWGVDIEAGADGASTALMMAAQSNRGASLEMLLDAGANIEAVTADGRTAVMIAASNGHAEIVQNLLYRDANAYKSTNIGETAVMMAAINGHIDVLRTLLFDAGANVNAADDANFTALMMAAQRGHTSAVEVLLEARADSAFRDDVDQHTALTLAAMNGYTCVVKALLAAGASTAAQLTNGCTALMLAAKAGNTEIVQALLDAKVDTEYKTVKEGYSALMLATVKRHAAIVAMLAAADADMECRSGLGTTPLVEAAKWASHSVLTALLESGASTETRTSNNGHTALMQAARYNQIKSLVLLLDAGALIDAQTASGHTALALAAHHSCRQAVELLVHRGASTKCRTPAGLTPLMVMAQRKCISTMKVLLEANASMDALAPDGRSAEVMVQAALQWERNFLLLNEGAHENP